MWILNWAFDNPWWTVGIAVLCGWVVMSITSWACGDGPPYPKDDDHAAR